MGRRRGYLAAAALWLHGEQPVTDLQAISYSEQQVLGEWFPSAE